MDAPLKMWVLPTIQKVITLLSPTLRSHVLLIRYKGITSVINSVIIISGLQYFVFVSFDMLPTYY